MNEGSKEKLPWYKFSGSGSNLTLKIESSEDAYKTIMDTAWGLIFVGCIMIAMAFILPGVWFDAAIFICLGSLLGYKKKLWTAWAVTLLSGLSLVVTFYNQITGALGGRNVLLAMIVLFYGVKSLYAIRYMDSHGASFEPIKKLHKAGEKFFPYLFWISLVPIAIFGFLTVVGLIAISAGYSA